jgi:hypothetical protein
VIQLRGREKACENAAGGRREHRAIPQVPPKRGIGAERRAARLSPWGCNSRSLSGSFRCSRSFDLGTPYL